MSTLYLFISRATGAVCLSGCCDVVLSNRVRTFHSATHKVAVVLFFCLPTPSLLFAACRSVNRSARTLLTRATSEPVWVAFWLTISWNCLQSIWVLLAFAGLAAHSWQIKVISVARTSQDKLTPVSVAVTDQKIGLFISALCEVHVTMHRLAQSTTERGGLSYKPGGFLRSPRLTTCCMLFLKICYTHKGK